MASSPLITRFIVRAMSILPGLSLPPSASERVLELERILAHERRATSPSAESQTDPAALHLTEMPTERIRRFTHALATTRGGDLDNDAIDILTIRLLLNDFTSAVGHLRAVANIAASLIDNAASPVKAAQRFIKFEDRREAKQGAETRPQDGQDPGAS
jgi:hypothetical protein